MNATVFTRSPKPHVKALPDKIALLMHEARWLLVGAFGIYLSLVLWGFDRTDSGWSHVSASSAFVNPGGRAGAWLADLLLYLFGLSAWGFVALAAFLILWGYHRVTRIFGGDQRPLFIALSGFLVCFVAACGLEAMRFWSIKAALPLQPGGMVGVEVGGFVTQMLGFTGGTLILIGVFMAGLSLFTGLSWMRLSEAVGALLEVSWIGAGVLWERWQDRRIGKQVAGAREVAVESVRRKIEEHPEPLRIEPVELDIPAAPKAIARADKERQQPLFYTPDAVGGALPPLHLLAVPTHNPDDLPAIETLEFTSRLIERKLADFNVVVKVLSAYPGPVVTRYEIEPAVGVKGSQIVGLAKDLSRALSLVSIRVVETVPGKSCMALELPNPKRQIVRLSEIIGSKAYHGMHSPLSVALGKDIGGQPVVVDLAKMPHLLVAGTTGSGKSVGVNAMILSLVYKSEPRDVRMIMVDPKMLELSIYEGIPHLLAPVVTDMTKAANALNWCVGEMERRYKLMSMMGVRNLGGYNSKINEAAKLGETIPNPMSLTISDAPGVESDIGPEPLTTMPHIVVVIDELADLMMVVGKKVEELIARLAQKARAAGIHLILATQRPSVDVITGLIKANIPTRIAFQVSSKIDSRTILDQMGAEALLGQGDMLYLAPGTGLPVRVHGAFVADEEVHAVVDHLKKMGPPEYIDGILSSAGEDLEDGISGLGNGGSADAESDAMYDQAVEIVLKNRRPSISLVQRHLRIGYNRAARMIEAMEKAGLVSAANATGGRELLGPNRGE